MELKEGIFSKNPKPDFSQIEAAEILRDYNHSTLFIQILDDYVDGSQDLLKQISNEVEQISKRFANIKSII
jgi:Mg2+ and Co2+ transporter CorA